MEIITGKAMSRRNVLRGLGAAVALPFLDAMIPSGVRGGNSRVVRPKRFQAFYVPNGMALTPVADYWTPQTTGRDFELTPILEPFAPFRDQMLVLTGLGSPWNNRLHSGASGGWLTGILEGGQTEVEIVADVSVDQVLAREWSRETQLASLELTMDFPAMSGQCSGTQSCVYTHTLSWRGRTQPLTMEYNPRAVFERLFGDSGSTERAAREARLKQQKSIMDGVTDKLASLRRDLGSQDQAKLEEYTEAVRDVERRIGRAEEQINLDLPVMDEPVGVPTSYEEHMGLMLDLQVLALQTDLTRVSTFMFGKEQSGRSYPQIGVNESHHPLSHHGNNPEWIAKIAKINRYHTGLFAGYLAKLKATQDVEGTLLDNMIIMYGAGMSNSSGHVGDNLPILLLGGGGGTLQGGQHIHYEHRPTMADLCVAILDKCGLPVERFGISTEELPLTPTESTLSI